MRTNPGRADFSTVKGSLYSTLRTNMTIFKRLQEFHFVSYLNLITLICCAQNVVLTHIKIRQEPVTNYSWPVAFILKCKYLQHTLRNFKVAEVKFIKENKKVRKQEKKELDQESDQVKKKKNG